MILDLSIIGVIAIFAFFGYMSGAIRQIFKIIVLVISYFLSKPAAKLFYLTIAEKFDIPEQIALMIATAISWFIIAIILSIITSIITKFIYKLGKEELAGVDKFAGMLLSMLKVVAFFYIMIGTVMPFRLILEKKAPKAINTLDKSYVVGFIDDNNVVKNFFWIDYLSRLSDIQMLPSVQNKVGHDQAFGAILTKPKYRDRLNRIGSQGMSHSIMNDKLARDLIQDKDFQNYIMTNKVKGWIEDGKRELK